MPLHCCHCFLNCRFQNAHTVRNAHTAITKLTEHYLQQHVYYIKVSYPLMHQNLRILQSLTYI